MCKPLICLRNFPSTCPKVLTSAKRPLCLREVIIMVLLTIHYSPYKPKSSNLQHLFWAEIFMFSHLRGSVASLGVGCPWVKFKKLWVEWGQSPMYRRWSSLLEVLFLSEGSVHVGSIVTDPLRTVLSNVDLTCSYLFWRLPFSRSPRCFW